MDSPIITIGREYGSGGHETGKILAEKLGIPFYDKEILTRAAKESGICEDLFEHHDEKVTPSYLFSLVSGISLAADMGQGINMPLNHRIFLAQFEAIRRLASEGPCVIVGRSGGYVLKDQKNVLNVFLYASIDSRIQRIMRVENLPHDKAKEKIRKVDKQRHAYYNFYADGDWGQRANYHLMLRTDGLLPPDAADLLVRWVQQYSKTASL